MSEPRVPTLAARFRFSLPSLHGTVPPSTNLPTRMPLRVSPLRLGAFAVALLLAGCQAVPLAPQNSEIASLTQRITHLESGIATSSDKIDTVQTSIATNYQQTIATLTQQRQQAADAVYAAQQANQQNPAQNPYTAAVAGSLQIAAANLGGSDAQGMQASATALKLQLAGTQTSLAQLQAMHDTQLQTATTLQTQLTQEQGARTAAETQLAELQNQRTQLQSSLAATEDDRNQAQTTLAQKLAAENARLANDQALKKRFMFYLTIAGVLAGLAAALALRIYPPIALQLGLASGGFFLAAYLVAQIQPWMVFLVIGLAVAALAWAVFIRHQRLSSIADSALGAIQQLKARAASGDVVAQQAWEKLESDLRTHFGAQIGSLESEARQRLDKLPWLPSAASTSVAVPPVPPATPPPTPTATPASATANLAPAPAPSSSTPPPSAP